MQTDSAVTFSTNGDGHCTSSVVVGFYEKGASGSSGARFSFKDGGRQDGVTTVGAGLSEEGKEGTTGKCKGVEETGQLLK